MAYKPKILTVPEGGTGIASGTAYGVVCSGTSSTGSLQVLPSLGNSTDILTSNGAGALPSFQAFSGSGSGYVLRINTAPGNPADASTYFLTTGGALTSITASGNASTRLYIPVSGTITKVYGTASCASSGSNQNVTVSIRLNNSTDTDITTTLLINGLAVSFNNTALSTSVSAGDYIEIKVVTPTWATNPASLIFELAILIT